MGGGSDYNVLYIHCKILEKYENKSLRVLAPQKYLLLIFYCVWAFEEL